MKVIKVKACGGCPFVSFDDAPSDAVCCGLSADEDGDLPMISEDRDYRPVESIPRPDWCPLELGAVTVEVDR